MKTILILNGPNLNLTGLREPDVYGNRSFDDFTHELNKIFPEVKFIYHQSNVEGELINILHEYGFSCNGIVFNPGAYAHTSVAITDAIRAINAPVIEVHLSNVFSREEYRKIMLTASAVEACISGMGMKSYEAAIRFLMDLNS